MSLRSFLAGPHPAILDPANPRFVTGTEEDRKQARAEWHRERFIADVMRSDLEEIPRSDLKEHRYWIEDVRTGEFYVARRDGLIDLSYTSAAAYFVDASGLPVLLERPHGVKNRAELEAQRAEREQRRAERLQPRPRR